MANVYFYCAPVDAGAQLACDAMATALETRFLPPGMALIRRQTNAFGAGEGLHIRLMFATKSRYAIAGNLVWQTVRDGKAQAPVSGPELRTQTTDATTPPAAYRALASALVQGSGLPGEFGRTTE